MRPIVLRNGTVLLSGGLVETDLRLEGGRIVEIGAPADEGATVLDATGHIVAPALVDIHGDAFERQLMPRPKVFFPTDVAMLDTDRQLAANGIATAYHALTLSWEPGLRSLDLGGQVLDTIETLSPRLTVDHRVQLRWETFAREAIPLIARALQGPKVHAVAFNDHTSMYMRPFDMKVTERPFDLSPDFAAAALDDPRMPRRCAKMVHRSGLPEAEYIALLGRIWDRRADVPAMIAEVSALARAVKAPMLSHDDSQIETREYYRSMGATIAEFPMNRAAADSARAAGEAVVLGAPNVVRGGSHIGSLSSADCVEDGTCTILASDYVYPSMLAAAGRLLAERRAPIEAVWALISANPAEALGLGDRGEIAVGKRADLVVVDWPEGATPAIRATLSGGRFATLCGDLIRA